MAEGIVKQKIYELERVIETLEATNKSIVGECINLDEKAMELEKKNKKLAVENEELKKKIEELTIDCVDLSEENRTLKQLNRIDDTSTKGTLCKDLGSMTKQEIEYCAHDIESINTINELYESQPDPAANPVDEHAKRLYDKLIALETAGFSHEDAMSLIPMWMDD